MRAHVLFHRTLFLEFLWAFGTRVHSVLTSLVMLKLSNRHKLLEAFRAGEVVFRLVMLAPSSLRYKSTGTMGTRELVHCFAMLF